MSTAVGRTTASPPPLSPRACATCRGTDGHPPSPPPPPRLCRLPGGRTLPPPPFTIPPVAPAARQTTASSRATPPSAVHMAVRVVPDRPRPPPPARGGHRPIASARRVALRQPPLPSSSYRLFTEPRCWSRHARGRHLPFPAGAPRHDECFVAARPRPRPPPPSVACAPGRAGRRRLALAVTQGAVLLVKWRAEMGRGWEEDCDCFAEGGAMMFRVS